MEQIISKEELREYMKLKGQIRGAAIKEIIKYILKEEGKDGLGKLEDAMEKIGYSIKDRNIKAMKFYPLGLEATVLVAVKRLFNYDDKKFQEMGKFAGKFSIVIRLFMGYLVSVEKIVKEAPKMWRKYFTLGDFEIVELNEKEKYVILRIKNYHLHPTHCQTLIGYLSTILQIVVKTPVTGEETKCTFRGDEYHEYLLKW